MARRSKVRALSRGDAVDAARYYFPQFLAAREEALMLRSWERGRQYQYADTGDIREGDVGYGRPYSPDRVTTSEYENLRGLASNAFAGLAVATVSQLAVMEGISRRGTQDTLPVWDVFRRNRWGSKQDGVYRGALSQSVAYGVVLPGVDALSGQGYPLMATRAAHEMIGLYRRDDDMWAELALEAHPRYVDNPAVGSMREGWTVTLWDAGVRHHMIFKGVGFGGDGGKSDWVYLEAEEHGSPVPPIARCANRVTVDGQATGILEPVLPLLRRIDQDTFDRLIVQRFGAWQVRYIAGMAKPPEGTEAETKMRLRVEDLLTSTSPDTKFGVLPGGSLDNQIKATDADLRMLSAVLQIPPHHMLGLSSNLQAEALAAATEGLQRQGFMFRTQAGEFNETMARLVGFFQGDMDLANAWDLQTRWRNTESGSMSQAADALGKLALQLNVPLEMLWEQIPGWTDDDVARAKLLVENGSVEELLAKFANEGGTSGDPVGG